MKRLLVGVVGGPNSGVTLVSRRLREQHAFARLRIGYSITRMLMFGLGLSEDQVDGDGRNVPLPQYGGVTPHFLKQSLGFEWGRRGVHCDVWITRWLQVVAGMKGHVVADDLRFANEAAKVREAGGVIWRVVRPSVRVADNATERMRSQIATDLVLVNDSTPDAFMAKVDAAAAQALGAVTA